MTIIDRFSGEHAFLSNFYPCPVLLDGLLYRSIEHAYQAAKTHDPGWRRRIKAAPTAGEAKKLGRKVPLVKGWDSIKLDVMLDLLRQKFSYPGMRDALLVTKGAKLVEGNTWNDRYWGVCNGSGKNHLGRLLMQVRRELQTSKG